MLIKQKHNSNITLRKENVLIKINEEIKEQEKLGKDNKLQSTCFGKTEVSMKVKTEVYKRVVTQSLIYGSETEKIQIPG